MSTTAPRELAESAESSRVSVTKAPPFRERLRGDVEGVYERLWAVYMAALDGSKGYPSNCPKCRYRTIVEAPDWTARLKAVQFFVEQGFGRPPASTEQPAPSVSSRAELAELDDDELAALARQA